MLSFVQSGLGLLGSVYVFFLAVALGAVAGIPEAGVPEQVRELSVEGVVLAAVQVVAVVVLLVAGVRALGRRTRGAWRLLVAGLALHVALALYWVVRLSVLRGQLPAIPGNTLGSFTGYALLFAALPLVALGLVGIGAGRRWYRPDGRPGPG